MPKMTPKGKAKVKNRKSAYDMAAKDKKRKEAAKKKK
jgi:hypothetical protein